MLLRTLCYSAVIMFSCCMLPLNDDKKLHSKFLKMWDRLHISDWPIVGCLCLVLFCHLCRIHQKGSCVVAIATQHFPCNMISFPFQLFPVVCRGARCESIDERVPDYTLYTEWTLHHSLPNPETSLYHEFLTGCFQTKLEELGLLQPWPSWSCSKPSQPEGCWVSGEAKPDEVSLRLNWELGEA